LQVRALLYNLNKSTI